VQPADLDHVVVPEDPQLHPDGERVAFVRTGIDVDGDRYVRTIMLVRDGDVREFTHGPADQQPRWSPDGRMLAFLRKLDGDDEHPQVHVMSADGGEARPVTSFPLGVGSFAWSPDSGSLAVIGKRWVDELAELDAEERARRPRRITSLPFRGDGAGWIHERHAELHLVTVDGATEPRLLAPGRHDRSAPAWHPDGSAIVFLARPDDARPTDAGSVPFVVDTDTGEVEALAPAGMWSAVHVDAGGGLWLTGLPDVFSWPGCREVWHLERSVDGGGELTSVTAGLDLDVVPGAPSCATVGPRFVADGFVIAVEERGTTGLLHVRTEGWTPGSATPPGTTRLLVGERCVTGFAVSPELDVTGHRGRLVATVTEPDVPGELLEIDGGEQGFDVTGGRALTAFAEVFRAEVDVRETRRVVVERDGVELDVWAVLPDGFDAADAASVPVLFNIHGGPTSQYGSYFFDEFQVGAGAGYLVVGTNPRGSSGRGGEWARAVVGAWTDPDSVDTLDLERIVDGVAERFPQVDTDRVGIMGGSYGGYATARLIARTSRYRAAIVERGLLHWESFSGTSDIGPYFDRMFLGASVDDDPDVHTAASPVRTAGAITTPTLVLHSDNDWRCPPEQGEQFFSALQRHGVPSAYVRFPGEGHELTRSGKPKHRLERFEIVLEWHDRWVRGDD
jgi:dipeptidyl aminopeptidase/acylaminoacyl peptidase